MNRFNELHPIRRLALTIAMVTFIALLFFAYVQFLGGGRIPKVITRQQTTDGLTLAFLALVMALYLFLRPAKVRVSAPRKGRFRWRWVIVLIGLILLAAGLRFHLLEFQSLWRDEIASVARVETPTLSQALELGNWQDAWPSYHIPLFFFVRLAGFSEFGFRFLSALAGVLLLPTLFVLGRRMISARAGLIAAGIAVAIWTPMWYSQEMRSYSFLMLYSALSVYFWFRLAGDFVWRGKPSRFALIGYPAAAILTIYAHYYGLVLIAVEGLGMLLVMIRLRRIPLGLVAVYAGIGLSYLPWVPLMIYDLGKGDFWSDKPTSMVAQFLDYLVFVFDTPLVWIAVALFAIGVGLVLWRAARHKPDGQSLPLAVTPGIALAGWLVLPYAIAYVRSITATPILVNRYLLVSLPAAYLLLAYAATRLPGRKWVQSLAGAGLAAFAVIHFLSGPFYTQPNRTDLRGAVSYIASHEAGTPDRVIIGGYQGGKAELDYYFRKFGSSSTVDIKAGNAWQIDDTRAQLAGRNPRYIWFIGQHLFHEKAFEDFLASDYSLLSETKFYDVTVFLYENPSGG